MPTLRIKNLTPKILVLDRVVGNIGPDSIKDVDISVSEIEAVRPGLTRMQALGILEFDHFNVDFDGDDDTEFVTLEDIRTRINNAVGGVVGAGLTTGTVPLVGNIDGANTVYTSPVKWVRTATLTERLYYNGVRLIEGIGNDYIATESVPLGGYDTITLAFPPIAGDALTVDFYPI